MNIRRQGNFGFVESGSSQYPLVTFSVGKGWDNPMASFGPNAWMQKKIRVHGYDIIPMGENNALPEKVSGLLDHFYAGEGILGKIQGLQYGQGPKLYEEDIVDNQVVRKWVKSDQIDKWMKSWDHKRVILKWLTDLTHMQGFFWRGKLKKGARIGREPFIDSLEHIPYQKCRLIYPPDGYDEPQEILVGDWPYPDPNKLAPYPIFDPKNPFKHRVFMGYENVYSFCKDFMSTPRFLGAFEWLELAGTLAGLLRTYNHRSSALSLHIESPKEYWEEKEDELKDYCKKKNIEYSREMLEEYKDKAFMEFTAGITGEKNVGSFLHTQSFYDDLSNSFVGWKVNTIDKKIKDYIEAQILISKQADTAATSGFGLDPVLANLIIDGKLSSGSEKLYSIKVYNASETAIPEMIMFSKLNKILESNFNTNYEVGFYRTIVNAESNVSPNNRINETV